MEIKIKRLRKRLNAVIKAPSSKSYTNRALVISALAEGKSVLKNASFSEDSLRMVKALKEFGIKIFRDKKNLIVYGGISKIITPRKKIYIGNAGTAMRFLAGFSAIVKGRTIIDGNARMRQRPIKDLIDAMNSMGVNAYSLNKNGCPPVAVEGGNFIGGKCRIKADVSSQFLSSILMVAPYSEKGVEIEIEGKLTSEPYIDMTLDVMKRFGMGAKRRGNIIVVKRGKYRSREYEIEGDFSNASYFFAAAAITHGKIRVVNLNPNSAQGDKKFADLLKRMGCRIKKMRDVIEVEGGRLKGIDADMNKMPDIVPTLAVVAAFAEGKTKIRNVANLRVKESDRISSVARELRKIGAEVMEKKKGMEIMPHKLKGAKIETYNDHRIAMAFSIAGLAVEGIIIKNPSCVKKSFPGFFEAMKSLYK